MQIGIILQDGLRVSHQDDRCRVEDRPAGERVIMCRGVCHAGVLMVVLNLDTLKQSVKQQRQVQMQQAKSVPKPTAAPAAH